MKKSKIIFIVLLILFIILFSVGTLVYIYYMPHLTTSKFSFCSNNVNISFTYPENFHANYNTDEGSYSGVCTGLQSDPLMALYIEKCEYNLEGYTLEQYVAEIEKEDLNEFKKVSQEYIENSQNYNILRSEYTFFDEFDYVPNFIYYTLIHNNIFYNFKVCADSKQMYEKYKSSIESIMKTIQINDSNFKFEYELDSNNEKDIPYYYSILSDDDKKIYDDILKVFSTFKTIKDGAKYKVTCNKPFEEYIDILNAIVDDHPEYISPVFYSFDYDETKNEFSAYLDFDDMDNIEDYKKVMDDIDKVANDIINNMPPSLTKYGKYKYLAESICNLVEYDETGDVSFYGIEDVFLNKKAQCTGYAKAYQYLCNKLGLFCEEISGTSGNLFGHIWNVIKLNNEYYYIDTTWMDSNEELEIFNYSDSENTGHFEYLNNLNSDEYKVFTNTGNINWSEAKDLLKY